jgi:hypothetical protein
MSTVDEPTADEGEPSIRRSIFPSPMLSMLSRSNRSEHV